MFKYIADIISKISIKQRLTALGIVLFSVVVISVAPNLIKGLTQDNEELMLKVESQRKMINNLNQRMGELNDQIMMNQTTCTDRFIKREREIMEMLSEIETEVKKTPTIRAERPRVIIESMDTVSAPMAHEMIMAPEPTRVNDNNTVLRMLRNLKKNVGKNIKP